MFPCQHGLLPVTAWLFGARLAVEVPGTSLSPPSSSGRCLPDNIPIVTIPGESRARYLPLNTGENSWSTYVISAEHISSAQKYFLPSKTPRFRGVFLATSLAPVTRSVFTVAVQNEFKSINDVRGAACTPRDWQPITFWRINAKGLAGALIGRPLPAADAGYLQESANRG